MIYRCSGRKVGVMLMKCDYFSFILVTLLSYYKLKVNDKYLNKTAAIGKKDYKTKIMRFKQGEINLFSEK